MEVYTLSGLTYTILSTPGINEYSGNSIPIQFTKGSGSAFSPDVLTLNSDNISSGRRKLGMLVYVYETDRIYQFNIKNYDTLWGNATGATGPGGPTVVISDFGTTVKNNTPEGQAFINTWTASTISGVGGYDDTNASWKILQTPAITGGTFNHNTETLSLYNSTGGTITITGFTDVNVTGGTYSNGVAIFTNSTGGTFNVSGFFTGSTDNYITGGTFNHNTETLSLINVTGGTIDITGFTDVNVTGGTYSNGTTTFTNNTGGTFNVSGFTKQGDYVESVTGDGVNNTNPLNPVISQNSKVNVISVTLGDLGVSEFLDNSTMLFLSKLYLNSLNQNIPYDTLYQLEINEGTGTTPSYPTTFISKWNVGYPGETISLPYESGGNYSGGIDWGDGTISINSYSNRTHTYTNSGTYTIKINGVISGFNFSTGSANSTNIREINQWGNLDIGNNGYYFQSCNSLILTGVTDTLKLLSGTTNLTTMFYNCSSLTTINNGNNWDVSNVTGMTAMFAGCTNFNQNIGGWNTSKVTDMSYMFSTCNKFNQNIGSWDVSNVTTMQNMFICSGGGGVFNNNGSPSISGWTTSKVTNMSFMFNGQPNFNQPIGSWDVSRVTNMSYMFRVCTNFNQNIGDWNISGVTTFYNFMLDKTPSTFSTTNLDSIYNGWVTKNPKTGRTITFGSAKYTTAGQTSKNILTGSTLSGGYGWTITDGGI